MAARVKIYGAYCSPMCFNIICRGHVSHCSKISVKGSKSIAIKPFYWMIFSIFCIFFTPFSFFGIYNVIIQCKSIQLSMILNM